MRRYFVVMTILVGLCLPTYKVWGGYGEPAEIFSGPLDDQHYADDESELGKTLSLDFIVLNDGSYVEADAQDNIRIYNPSSLLKQFNVSQGINGIIHFYDQYIYIEGTGKFKNNIYIYDYTGNLKSTINSLSGRFKFALPNGDFITHTFKTENYYRYSLSGQLLKAYASKPFELGVVQKQPLGNRKYKTTVTYDDRAYVIVGRQYSNFQRDENNNLYAVEPGFVSKFSPCGKLLGQVKMPSDVVFTEENVKGREPEIIDHDLYGEPKIDIHGNLYTWKKTPTQYSILKWTWVDDLNVPTGPDAPTGLSLMPSTTGLYLTWTASSNDPGCVTGYEVARATSSGGVYSPVATVSTSVVKYNDTTAEVGTMYYLYPAR